MASIVGNPTGSVGEPGGRLGSAYNRASGEMKALGRPGGKAPTRGGNATERRTGGAMYKQNLPLKYMEGVRGKAIANAAKRSPRNERIAEQQKDNSERYGGRFGPYPGAGGSGTLVQG